MKYVGGGKHLKHAGQWYWPTKKTFICPTMEKLYCIVATAKYKNSSSRIRMPKISKINKKFLWTKVRMCQGCTAGYWMLSFTSSITKHYHTSSLLRIPPPTCLCTLSSVQIRSRTLEFSDDHNILLSAVTFFKLYSVQKESWVYEFVIQGFFSLPQPERKPYLDTTSC